MTFEIVTRQFQTRDAEAVIALWQTVLPSSLPWNDPRNVLVRKLNRYDGLVFVAELNNGVVGAVIAGYDGVRGWIYSLAVSPEHQRCGIGRRLLKEAQSALHTLGCPKVNLRVRSKNSEMLAFYQRCDYEIEDRSSLGKRLRHNSQTAVDPVPTIPVADGISLSRITWRDKPAYVKHLNQTHEFHSNMLSIPFPYSEDDADQWISTVLRESFAQDGRRSWAIRDGADLIGGVGLFDITEGVRAEIGYWLAKPYWGQGIMTRVVRRLCSFAFDQYQLIRIQARAFAINPRSASVLHKAGFNLEGTLRCCFVRDGQPVDDLIFGLVKERTENEHS